MNLCHIRVRDADRIIEIYEEDEECPTESQKFMQTNPPVFE